jgi:hypothetical protein
VIKTPVIDDLKTITFSVLKVIVLHECSLIHDEHERTRSSYRMSHHPPPSMYVFSSFLFVSCHYRTRFCYAASATRRSTARAWLHHRRLCLTDVTGLATTAEPTSRWRKLRSRTARRKKAKLRTTAARSRRHRRFSPWRQLVSVRGCLARANWNSRALRSSGIASPIPTRVFPTLRSGLRKTFKVTSAGWDSKSRPLCCATM